MKQNVADPGPQTAEWADKTNVRMDFSWFDDFPNWHKLVPSDFPEFA
jgi:hypothetical protein